MSGLLRRRGFTLIEMMVSLVITLGMVYAMVEVFARIGQQTTESRAVIEMLGQIRGARYRLEQDLKGLTVPTQPWINADAAAGYFELMEGVGNDSDPNHYIAGDATIPIKQFVFSDPNNRFAQEYSSMFGDVDDVICFTARNDQEPFRGRFNGTVIESNLAEILWWAELRDGSNGTANRWDPGETFVIRRRVLLIRPDLNQTDPSTAGGRVSICDRIGIAAGSPLDVTNFANRNQVQAGLANFWQNNDVSIHPQFDPGTSNVIGAAANTLGDLSLRENRTARHVRAQFTMNATQDGTAFDVKDYLLPALQGNNFGEDVVLTNVLAFDFRVFDPNADLIYDSGYPQNYTGGVEPNEILSPGDPGYEAVVTNPPAGGGTSVHLAGRGAYVDLGANIRNPTNGALSLQGFLGGMQPRCYLANAPGYRFYDTWPLQYEKDGYNQDGDNDTAGNPLIDEATNGLDDDNANGVDDAGERETSPPYPYPLRGIQVKIRMYESDTRQVRQASYAIGFVQD